MALAACYAAYQWAKPYLCVVVPAPAVSRPTPTRAVPCPAEAAPPRSASPSPSALPAGAWAISKCVVNGTTRYGDAACGRGAKTSQIVTPVNHHLLAGLTPEQMAAASRVKAATSPAGKSRAAPPSAAASAEVCASLNADIIRLDALGRQLQSGQLQDWIRQRKREARDRQFWIRCQ